MRKYFVKLFLVALICLLPVTLNAEEKKRIVGLSVFHGVQISEGLVWHYAKAHDWKCTIIHPMYGWVLDQKKELYLEGRIGSYDFDKLDDTLCLGLNLMGRYNFARFDRWSLFAELGGGLSWWNNAPSYDLVEGHFPANINYGVGLKFLAGDKTLKLAYRFTHASVFRKNDTGINSHGILFGIEF